MEDAPVGAAPLPMAQATDVESCAVGMRASEPAVIAGGRGFLNLNASFIWTNLPGAYLQANIFGVNQLQVPAGYYHVVLEAVLHFHNVPESSYVGELAYRVTMSLDSLPQVSYFPQHEVVLPATGLDAETYGDAYDSSSVYADDPIARVRLSSAVLFSYEENTGSSIVGVRPEVLVRANAGAGYESAYVGIADGRLTCVRLAEIAGVNDPNAGGD